MSAAPSIVVDGLVKDFKGDFWKKKVRVLHGLSFSVERGSLFGFLGPNGAGKTTTIKILLDILRPTAGHVLLFDRPTSDVDVRARVGYLPENPFFYDYLTGAEFLDFYASLFRLSRRERRERVNHLLARVGLAHAATLALRKYSKGMLQRVGIAQALINDPELLILDEPMSGLDPIGRREVRELILDLHRQGKTIFFSTHILSDAEEICQNVALIVRGRISSIGPLDQVLSSEERRYEVEFRELDDPALAEFCRQHELQWLHRGTVLSLTLPSEELIEPFTQFVYSRGGKLISLRPLRQRLEEVFVRDVQNDRQKNDRR